MHSFTTFFNLLLLRKSQIDTTELYLYVTLHPCICCYRNEQRFPLLLETSNAFRVVTQTYFNSDHTIDFCVVKVFMAFLETRKSSQAYEMSVSKKRVHTKRTTLHFFVRNGERFPLLLETNNAFRIVTQTYFNSDHTIDFCVVKVFMGLLETEIKFLKLTKRP